MRRSAWRPLLVSARLNHCVAFNPSPVTSLIHPFIHPVSRTHVRVSRSPTTFSPCPALSCFHTHTDSRSLSRWLPHARYLAYTQPSSHIVTPHRTLTLHLPAPRYRAPTLSHVHLARSVSLYNASLCHSTFCLALTLAQYHAVPFSSCAALSHTTVTLSRSHDHTDTRSVSHCRTLGSRS